MEVSDNSKQIRALLGASKGGARKNCRGTAGQVCLPKIDPLRNSQRSRMPSSDSQKALGGISERETALLSVAPAEASRESWQSYKTASSPWVSESTNNLPLIWEIRSNACRWPMWDSWATLPQVEQRFYCGASCAGAYCSDHAAIAGQGWGSSKKRLGVTA
jgi:hypothetical protein